MSKPKQVCMKFYTEVIDADKPLVSTWRCKCNTLIKQKKNKGYTNLLNHILSKHKEEYDQMEKQTEPTLDAFIDKKAKIYMDGLITFLKQILQSQLLTKNV